MKRNFCCVFLLTTAILISACGGGGEGGSSNNGGSGSTTTPPPPVSIPEYRASGKAAAGETFAVLWEWPWPDVALACEIHLGPDGYGAVLVSAPNEHAVLPSYPWYQRYQPVSYKLDQSRSGNAAQFTEMLARCNAKGVAVYVDAIINHMAANVNGAGSAGSPYQRYEYPAVPYVRDDFHNSCSINNYQNANNVQNCELVSLPDLKTEAETVRQKIAGYLIALNKLGVKGFRIDAAKHIAPTDLDAILAKVNQAATAEGRAIPYVFLEIINNAGEAVTPQQYFGAGFASGGAADITEFQAAYQLTDAFIGRNGRTLAELASFGQGLLPTDKAHSFVTNHDTERGNLLYWGDGALYRLAQIFLLAHPYGYPAIHSGYQFDRNSQAGRDAGPASDANGLTLPVFGAADNTPCGMARANQWTCDHYYLGSMVGFRKAVAGTALTRWQSPNANAIGFARGNRGFVALNRANAPLSGLGWQTDLPAGQYCNVAIDRFDSTTKTCSGIPVTIGADGTFTMAIAAQAAVALHVGARVD